MNKLHGDVPHLKLVQGRVSARRPANAGRFEVLLVVAIFLGVLGLMTVALGLLAHLGWSLVT
jgi:hypothetical protein